MAEYLIQDSTLTEIADAVRAKTKKTDTILVSDLAEEINGISGGDADLNFEVVGGTTEPSNPTENTIWVNTNTNITSWDFSATEPYRRSGNKNLNVYPYYNTTTTINNVVFTDNKDGTITVNGTASADTLFRCSMGKPNQNGIILLPGTYTLSDVNGFGNDCRTEIGISYDNGSSWTFYACKNNTPITFNITKPAIGRISIKVYSGITVNNVVLKPQLEKGSVATDFIKGDAVGQVWIQTVASSHYEFNGLQTNGIQIYPSSAKQFINGSWEFKSALIYQNGIWNGFNVIPTFEYSGTYQILDDDDNAITESNNNWKIKFLTSGTLQFTNLGNASNGIDVFLVGGGGNGGSNWVSGGSGGGGGYTLVEQASLETNTNYKIIVGGAAGATKAFGHTANQGGNGQKPPTDYGTASGGAGTGQGGASGVSGKYYANGGNGGAGIYEFHDAIYSSNRYGGGGGGGGGYTSSGGSFYNKPGGSGGAGGGGNGNSGTTGTYTLSAGVANTGGGGGGQGGGRNDAAGNPTSGAAGGSGIVIIRNKRG